MRQWGGQRVCGVLLNGAFHALRGCEMGCPGSTEAGDLIDIQVFLWDISVPCVYF